VIDSLSEMRLRDYLGPCPIGSAVRILEEADSTNSILAAWNAQGAPHGAAVFADRQTAGRGRLQRSWFSPPGLNIYTSILLREHGDEGVQKLVYLAGVAVAETVIRLSGISPFLKWPNDVLAAGRKLCGILCERHEGKNGPAVILGIGLNVNAGETDFPADLRPIATSMKIESGRSYDRVEVLAELYKEIERFYISFRRGPSPLIERWKTLADFPKIRYEVAASGGSVAGLAVDIDPEGALVLRKSDGSIVKIFSGDVLKHNPEE
jgi:BirA family transcriptional regulator, biotin operon repressor / biotin---[acetyl-CoA-carboxylase] ligase